MAPELRSRSAPNENGAAATVTDSLAASTPVDSGHTAANAVHSAKAERKAAKRKAAEDADPDWPPQKTLLRGVLHQHMALAALTAGIMLVATAPGTRAKIGCGIYAGSLTLQLTCSALYHVPAWGHRTRTWLRRLDHAAIFTLIAGTYTPLCMLALDRGTANLLLSIEWGAAVAGMVQTLFWVSAPKQLKTALYIFLGWVVLPWVGQMREALGLTVRLMAFLGAWLIAAGGVTYTVGGTIYALRRPDPWPRTFGYHEIFHCATVLASIFHFTAVYRMVHHPTVPP